MHQRQSGFGLPPVSGHCIGENADWRDGDLDDVARLQAEIVRRDDTGAGHEETADWEAVFTKEKFHERGQRPLDPCDARRRYEDRPAPAPDGNRDGRGRW